MKRVVLIPGILLFCSSALVIASLEIEPNDTLESATPVNLGSHYGCIDPDGDVDIFGLSLDADNSTLSAEALGELVVQLSLLDSGGGLLAEGIDAVMVPSVSPGSYFLSLSAMATGCYELVIDATPAPNPSAAIDIKPGSDPNCFNINGHGVIPVAILGAVDFDVGQVIADSLIFGGLEVRVRGNKGPLCHFEDTNADGFTDLVCQFQDDAENWSAGDTVAELQGTLTDGSTFSASDSICIVP